MKTEAKVIIGVRMLCSEQPQVVVQQITCALLILFYINIVIFMHVCTVVPLVHCEFAHITFNSLCTLFVTASMVSW